MGRQLDGKHRCYFCDKITKNVCQECGKIDGELYCPLIFDNCRICNKRIIIASGEQPNYVKNRYCSNYCAGEWTHGLNDVELETVVSKIIYENNGDE